VQQRSWPEALAAARDAVRLRPDDAEARLNLGTAAAHTGDAAEARRQYERLLKLDKPRAERLKAVLDRDGGKEE
jgi:Flp pilus assembly protein TadD